MSHAVYVVVAYAVSALAIGGLALFILADQAARKRELVDLEERGHQRRSARR